MRKCKHKFELQNTAYQYPRASYVGTTEAQEYAYLLCQKCWEVRKVLIKEVKQ